MLDVVNEGLIAKGEDPIAFDSDCREGICGTCGFMIDGLAHGPMRATTVCQLHMRSFKDGDTLTLEPWRAKAFPIVKDLVVDRSAMDRVIQAGGYTSVNVGGAQDANAILIPKPTVEQAMDAAQCIQCGACVAACKNASAALFTVRQGVAPGAAAAGPGRALHARRPHGRAPRRRGLRQLLQRGGVRSRLPEGDLDHQHRADEPRVRHGDPRPRPVGRNGR